MVAAVAIWVVASVVLAPAASAYSSDGPLRDLTTLPPQKQYLIPRDPWVVAVVISEPHGGMMVFHARKDVLFGAANSTDRALAEAYNLEGKLYVSHTYSTWMRGNRALTVGTPETDPVLGHRLLLGTAGKRIKPPGERPTFPLRDSLRGENMLAPRRVIFSDPLQTLLPFVFTRYASVTMTGGYWNVAINSGKNVFTLSVSSAKTPPVEVIATPKSAKLRESRFPSWPRYLYISSSETSALVNVAAGTTYKPRLYNATLSGVERFLKIHSYAKHASAGQLITLKHLLKYGCKRSSSDEMFVVSFALRFGAAWHRFVTMFAQAYATDEEILDFVVLADAWAKQVSACLNADDGGQQIVIPNVSVSIGPGGGNESDDQGPMGIPYRILRVVREGYWAGVRNPAEQLIILNAVLGSVDSRGAEAYRPSADGIGPHRFAADIIATYYRRLIRGAPTDRLDRKVLSAAVRVFLARKAEDASVARRVLTQMTVLCSEKQTQNPLIDATRIIDADPDSGELFGMDDIFTPCAASLRFDLEKDPRGSGGNALAASAVFRALYGSVVVGSGGGEKETEELLGQTARVIGATPPVGSARSYADMFFPELARCFDWDREDSVVVYFSLGNGASWVLTTRPVAGGMKYRLPDTSIRANLYLTYFNVSCVRTPFNSRAELVPDGYVNLRSGAAGFGCKLCNHALLRYSLGGFEDMFVIETAEEERDMAAGPNSTITYFRSMDPEYYNYVLLDQWGSATRVLAFTRETYAVDREYVIGIVVGSLVGILALVFAIWSIAKFCRGRNNRYRILDEEEEEEEDGGEYDDYEEEYEEGLYEDEMEERGHHGRGRYGSRGRSPRRQGRRDKKRASRK